MKILPDKLFALGDRKSNGIPIVWGERRASKGKFDSNFFPESKDSDLDLKGAKEKKTIEIVKEEE